MINSMEVGVDSSTNTRWSSSLRDAIKQNENWEELRVQNVGQTTLEDLQNIFQALEKNRTLRVLSLKDKTAQSSFTGQAEHPLSKTYAESLATNTVLTHLSLENLKLGGVIQSLAIALRHNKTLQSLRIIDNSLTSEDLNNLRECLVFNRTLAHLELPDYLEKFESYASVMAIIADNQADKDNNAMLKRRGHGEENSINSVALKKELEEMAKELARTQKSKAELMINNEFLEQVIANNSEATARLERENQELKQAVNDITVEESVNTSRIGQLTQEIVHLRRENKMQRDQITLLEQNSLLTTKQLQREIKLIKEENAKLKKMLEAGEKSEHSSDNNELNVDIPFDELTIGESIGAGGYGEVFKAQWHDQNVAVKGIKIEDIETGKIDSLIHEARTVMRLHHKHVVLSMGTTMKPDTSKIMLVMEYMKHGSLEDLLFKHRVKLQRHQVTVLALDIAKGLNYLHCLTPKIIHRDLKCANILLYHNRSRAKISDLGTARFLNKNSLAKTCQGGTIGYFAPEILEEEEYDEKADVYSFGIVLLVLATSSNNLPTTRTPAKLRSRINELLDASATMADEEQFRELVHDCCQVNPKERPSMKQCIDVLKSLRKKHANNNN